ncbi:hypothetical protein BCV70DRAFT_200483 [Testicularia cyperi]|uniref:Wbp11/ELF5/Saf1 N-terminal domain-containing protein n=1 Tax=Testicularia cyperi TaxID=1882483 RepID=A0A317XSN7_9BASI|nr:hypothetical protein BCV70DRAFT_200483 [Testicularia cyperi]
MDPVQAARKAAQKREAKRNRERKEQAAEARTLRQDTSGLERQIARLEARLSKSSSSTSQSNSDDQVELNRLKAELDKINKVKQDYVDKHPDQRHFVRGFESADGGQSNTSAAAQSRPSQQSRTQSAARASTGFGGVQNRDPRWSIYYDAVFNPFGAPPPGMPYLEKSHDQLLAEGLLPVGGFQPPLPPEEPEENEAPADGGADGASQKDGDEADQSDDDDQDDEEDMSNTESIHIDLPEGPPDEAPPTTSNANGTSTTQPQQVDSDESEDSSTDEELKGIFLPAGPPPLRVSLQGGKHRGERYAERGRRRERGRGGRDSDLGGRGRGGGGGGSRGRGRGRGIPSTLLPARPGASLPPRPSHPSASSDARTSAPIATAAATNSAVITAAPQLRDFKAEATAFVPTAIRRKQADQKSRIAKGLPGRIDAAPSIASHFQDQHQHQEQEQEQGAQASSSASLQKPDLVKSIQAHLPPPSSHTSTHRTQKDSRDHDYDAFLERVGDLL